VACPAGDDVLEPPQPAATTARAVTNAPVLNV